MRYVISTRIRGEMTKNLFFWMVFYVQMLI